MVTSQSLAQCPHHVCNSSAIQNMSKRNQELTSPDHPSPTYRKAKQFALLTCSHECSQANIPTSCLPGFYPLALLGLFCICQKQSKLPICCVSSSSPVAHDAGDEAGQAGLSTRHSFATPAHGRHEAHLCLGGASWTTHLSSSSQGSEQSLRGWGPFHIFPPTGMTKPSRFYLLSRLA